MKLLLPAFASIVGALLLPNPDGPYPVAMRVHTLTDKNRVDPYAPNATDKRQILVSVFWPIDKSKECSPETVPYMPPATAQAYGLWASSNGFSNDTFSQFQLEVCGVSNVKGCRARTKSQYPLVLLSPGSGNSRLLHSAMAKSLSSYGYVVVTVDHPYDANIVEFPDGTMILGADIPETDESLEKATLVRAQDLSFVISQFKDLNSRQSLTKGLPGSVDLKKIVAFGHSLGGAAVAQTMLLDKRLLGGMNLDGRLFDSVLSKGLDKPFGLLGRPDHRSQDPTWNKFWGNLRGPKVQLEVAGTLHASYTDMPLLVEALGLPKEYQKTVESLVGSVPGKELQSLLSKVVSGFFTYVLDGRTAEFNKAVKGSKRVSLVERSL